MTGVYFVFAAQVCLFFLAGVVFNFLTGGMLSKDYWSEWTLKAVLYISFFVLFLIDSRRYLNKNNRKEIERKFSTSHYNKSIKIWQIFSIPILLVALAIILILALGK